MDKKMKIIVLWGLLLLSAECLALGPSNICESKKEISLFSKMYSWEQEEFGNQLTVKIEVPNAVKTNYQLVLIFLSYSKDGNELMRLPMYLQEGEHSTKAFYNVLVSETNNISVFASYSLHGMIVKDGHYCEFKLRPNK